MRRLAPLLVVCLCAAVVTAQPSGWDAWLDAARKAQAQASAAIDAIMDSARPLPRRDGIALMSQGDAGIVRTPLADAVTVAPRMILLVHGLDEPGSIWDDLTPALLAGTGPDTAIAEFNYPDDQPIADSASMLVAELRAASARGVQSIDLVCHSMGGLVARDALSRGQAGLPVTPHLILVGSPLAGSPWARLRAVAELKEQIERWAADESLNPRQLLGFMTDGDGQAGTDLLPGSAYLAELSARPWPAGPRTTFIIGTLAPAEGPDLSWIDDSAALRSVLGNAQTDRLVQAIDQFAHSLGDGVVSVSSATPGAIPGLPDAADIVQIEASHRGMLKRLAVEQQARSLVGEQPHETPPAIPVIFDRLGLPSQEP